MPDHHTSHPGSPPPNTALNEIWEIVRDRFSTPEQFFALGTYCFTRASDLAGWRNSHWGPVPPQDDES